MEESMEEQTRSAFESRSTDDRRWFMERLITAASGYTNRSAHQVGLLLLAVAIFELLAAGPDAATVALGPLTVGRPDLVLLAIPPLIAYFLLEAVVNVERARDARASYEALLKLWNDQAESADLAVVTLGAQPLFWNIGRTRRLSNQRQAHRVEGAVSLALMSAVVIGYLAYEIRVFAYLFAESDLPAWLVSISVALTLGAVVAAVMIMMAEGDEPR